MLIRLLKLLPLALLLTACGGSGGKPPPSGNPTNPGTTTVDLGSGTGGNFQSGTMQISSTNLSAGGSTSLQVVLQKSDGTLYTEAASVTFSSPCQAQGLATITTPVETSTGIASAQYGATGCSGSDVISATATIGGKALLATGTVNVAQAAIGSIVFESATPANIALRGSGSTEHPETSVVVFRVLDRSDGPRAGAVVQFALNSDVGGISLSSAQETTDATGRVQTVVQGGTVSTSVRVTATVADTAPMISTQSSQLTVTTGVPDQNSFSMAVECSNVEAWLRDGVQVPVTVRLADRFNNPVPDGTAVTFTTEGGNIQSTCATQTTATESGVCTVNWTSSGDRPGGGLGQSGRSSLLATAIGEESFNDANGNGSFDNGESFVDLGERFLDENENRLYDPGEPIYDFYNTGPSRLVRDPADTFFNGVLCLDTTGRCNAAFKTTGIGASNLIIMSNNAPDPTLMSPKPVDGLGTIRPNNTISYLITFPDLNNNPLPAKTVISATISGTGLSLGTPSSFTVPCTTEVTSYSFTVIASATAAGSGSLKVKVLSPNGTETYWDYGITVVP